MKAPQGSATWGAPVRALLADPERVTRWVVLIAAVIAVLGLSITLGATVSPVVGWAAAAAVTLALSVALWRREFEVRTLDRTARQDLAARPVEGFSPGLGGSVRLPQGPAGR